VIVEDHSTYGTFLNGSRLEGRASLAAGDRLRLGTPGIVLQLIAVE
jgi:pSer/pThr/pTyr-binding forkhead associated (FHA) protein